MKRAADHDIALSSTIAFTLRPDRLGRRVDAALEPPPPPKPNLVLDDDDGAVHVRALTSALLATALALVALT